MGRAEAGKNLGGRTGGGGRKKGGMADGKPAEERDRWLVGGTVTATVLARPSPTGPCSLPLLADHLLPIYAFASRYYVDIRFFSNMQRIQNSERTYHNFVFFFLLQKRLTDPAILPFTALTNRVISLNIFWGR